jgi:hypothetical protein
MNGGTRSFSRSVKLNYEKFGGVLLSIFLIEYIQCLSWCVAVSPISEIVQIYALAKY